MVLKYSILPLGSCQLTGFLYFSRVMSKLHRTQRLATGKNTSTSSSTLSVQPLQWRRKRWRNHKVTHHPLQTGWAPHPTHRQRRGLEKCLVRLIGKLRRKWELWDERVDEIKMFFLQMCNYGPVFIRQGQASCYEGSGRAPPLGPPPSVDHPTVPPTHKEGIGISQTSFYIAEILLFCFKEICLLLQSHLVPFSQTWSRRCTPQPTCNQAWELLCALLLFWQPSRNQDRLLRWG